MVNRVNGNDYYDYSKLKMPDAADKTGNGEKFSLNYQRAQEEDEDKDKKEQIEEGKKTRDNSVGGKGQRTVMQSGVKLELSANAQSVSDRRRDNTTPMSSSGSGLFDTLRSWIADFIQSIKAFLYKVWNDEAPQDIAEEETAAEKEQDMKAIQETESVLNVKGAESTDESERLTEEYLELQKLENLRSPEAAARQRLQHETDRDKEIQKYLRNGNLEQVISLVTQNGQKTIAKNSTLLTYYDRTGKITPLSASDQERILHGDRNVRKL